MGPVEPDVRFRRLAQVIGVRAVMRDCKMLVVAAWVGTDPPDNGEVVASEFKPWALGEFDVCSLLRRGGSEKTMNWRRAGYRPWQLSPFLEAVCSSTKLHPLFRCSGILKDWRLTCQNWGL
jgi:hypothetical protein